MNTYADSSISWIFDSVWKVIYANVDK